MESLQREDTRHRLHREHLERLARMAAGIRQGQGRHKSVVIWTRTRPYQPPRPPLRFKPITFKGNATGRTLLGLLARFFKVSVDEILSEQRPMRLVLARRATCYAMYMAKRWSMPQIGKVLGKDHTTILHHIKNAEHKIKTDDAMRRKLTDATCICRQAIEPGFDFVEKQ